MLYKHMLFIQNFLELMPVISSEVISCRKVAYLLEGPMIWERVRQFGTITAERENYADGLKIGAGQPLSLRILSYLLFAEIYNSCIAL